MTPLAAHLLDALRGYWTRGRSVISGYTNRIVSEHDSAGDAKDASDLRNIEVVLVRLRDNPSPEMLDAGGRLMAPVRQGTCATLGPETAGDVWRVMMDAAIKEVRGS